MVAVTQVFVSGRELNAGFYAEVVAPLVHAYDHAAALLGWGSDVLGYDTARSTDHGWGPRLQLFVGAADVMPVRRLLDAGLPERYRGFAIRYGWDDQTVRHWVDVQTLGDWLTGQVGLDPRGKMHVTDWLCIPQQRLLGVVRGAVYADPRDELAAVRDLLGWYPMDVWRWLLACQWRRIGQEEAFPGRAAEVGDELGSRVLAARLARELMRLAFLQERTYWPYSKWFGTAFSQLDGAAELIPVLESAVAATGFDEREAALVAAYELLADRHNSGGIGAAVDASVRAFHGRPYRVLGADRFACACRNAIEDPGLRGLPLVGSVDQFVDSTDVLSGLDHVRRLRAIFNGVS
jgi:Domain of unknown function (DUF4037)